MIAERDDEHQQVRDADRQELQEPLDQRDVGRRPAHELTGLQFVVTREVEALELGEDRRTDVVLHVERNAAAPEAPQVREHERRDTHDDHQREPRRERLLVRGDHIVDDHLLHDGQQRLDELAAGRDTERDVRVLLVRLHVADEPANPTLPLGGLRGRGRRGRPLERVGHAFDLAEPFDRARRERVVEIDERPDQRVAIGRMGENALERLSHLLLRRPQTPGCRSWCRRGESCGGRRRPRRGRRSPARRVRRRSP